MQDQGALHFRPHEALKSSSDLASHAAFAAASEEVPHCGISCLASHAVLAAASSFIVAEVDADRVAELIDPDHEAMRKLIAKTG